MWGTILSFQESTLCQKLTPRSPNPTGGAITSFADEDNDAAAKTQVHPRQDWKVSPGSEGPLHHEELSTGSGTAPRLWGGGVELLSQAPLPLHSMPIGLYPSSWLITNRMRDTSPRPAWLPGASPLQGTSASLSWKCAKSWYGRVHAFIPSFTQIHSNIY